MIFPFSYLLFKKGGVICLRLHWLAQVVTMRKRLRTTVIDWWWNRIKDISGNKLMTIGFLHPPLSTFVQYCSVICIRIKYICIRVIHIKNADLMDKSQSHRNFFILIWYNLVRSRSNPVSIVSGYGLDDHAVKVQSPSGARHFPVASMSRPALGPT
jgi:hypothetical protein